MERNELKTEYDNGDLDDPSRLQQVRDAVREHTGLHVPRRVGDVEDWWERNKSTVARKLNDEEDGEDDEADEDTENGEED